MTKSEFSRAMGIVQAGRELDLVNWMAGGMSLFDGFGLKDFSPVACSLMDMARLICYQCLQFDGEFDKEAVSEIWNHRRRFHIIGEGSDECLADETLNAGSKQLLKSMCLSTKE